MGDYGIRNTICFGDNCGMQITVIMVCFAITVFEVRYAQRLRYVNYFTHDVTHYGI